MIPQSRPPKMMSFRGKRQLHMSKDDHIQTALPHHPCLSKSHRSVARSRHDIGQFSLETLLLNSTGGPDRKQKKRWGNRNDKAWSVGGRAVLICGSRDQTDSIGAD